MSARENMHRLGWPGLVGLVALMAAAACVLLAQRWDAEASASRARAEQMMRRMSSVAVPVRAADAPLAPKAWLAQLPAAALRQERLADLLELAIRNDLSSARTDYHLATDTGLGVEHLRVSMPVSGRYAQLRAFIEAALAQDPGLSLDELKLQRAGPQSDRVDAEMVWSLHGRIGSAS
jgi:hypothetical protein